MPGQIVCGDMALVKAFPGGVLLAVVDGLGHGEDAGAAAQAALDVLESHAEEPLPHLVELCHKALAHTRGAVMTLASLQLAPGLLTWVGVGNVEAVLWRDSGGIGTPPARLVQRNGLVGYQLPPLRPQTVPIALGDWLIFATDGISADFLQSLVRRQKPQELAERILARHFKGTDDALVLVARFPGSSSD